MIARMTTLALLTAVAFSQSAPSGAPLKECWALTNLVGHIAASSVDYKFQADKYSDPMVLCFDTKTGTVSGDDTAFTRFGTSTLAGWAENQRIELFEVFQIDRTKNKVLFTKTRIGTHSLIPGGPDIVAAFVGDAVKISK